MACLKIFLQIFEDIKKSPMLTPTKIIYTISDIIIIGEKNVGDNINADSWDFV